MNLNNMPAWLVDFSHEYVEEVLLTVLIGLMLLVLNRVRSWIAWRNKHFDVVTFSLHTLDDGQLCIDTVLEDNLINVFLNDEAIKLVQAAVNKTTGMEPLLPLPDTPETGVALTALLNALSERFADGALARSHGLPVSTKWYRMAITWEIAVGFAYDVRKLRVVVIDEDVLAQLPEAAPGFYDEHHVTRWLTLLAMKRALAYDSHLLKRVRLSVRI